MIDDWLHEFKAGWIEKDVHRVLDLFVDDVEYWETPFKKLDKKIDMFNEWQVITTQSNLDINLSVYSKESNKCTVKWTLSYVDSDSATQNWAGTYLVEINDDGKCIYFYQVGERLN